ncbi:MAG: ion transporter, partial [Planctomycetaceae bacterium]|nr:ion transporter [Planctomycetaceae bacterium]
DLATTTELQRRVRAFHSADHSSNPAESASRLADLERDLYGRRDPTGDEREFDSRTDSRILLSELDSWSRLAETFGLENTAEEARQITADHLMRLACAWRESVRSMVDRCEPDDCFHGLLSTTRRQLELHRRCPTGCEAGYEALQESRQMLRDALLQSLAESAPDLTRRKEWTVALVDRGDMILTAVDGQPPARASEVLKLVSDDLQWHMQHIERRFGPLRRRLARKNRRLAAERQERRLQGRLEEKFGRKFVARSERVVLILIVLVLVLMTLEYTLQLSPRVIHWFNLIDAMCCVVFLTEFGIKLTLAPGRTTWFRRHVLIDLIPAIPIGLIATGLESAAGVDAIRAGRVSRFLRLPRLARYVRIVRPAVRLIRGFGLLARGLDRLARQYGHILNQNVILYPTRQELQRSEQLLDARRSIISELRNEISSCWRELLTLAEEEHQPGIAACRLAVFRTELADAAHAHESVDVAAAEDVREIPAGILIEQLASATSQSLEATLGSPLIAQLSRMLRVLGRPPMRWLPVIASVVPPINAGMSDADATVAASRRLGAVLRRYHNIWFWVADLYGTVTPSQFVDRVGTTLVNSSFRPAYRLALFGGFFLLTDLVLRLTNIRALEPIKRSLNTYVGHTVLVMGGTCFVILLFGFWLKRMAREAT